MPARSFPAPAGTTPPAGSTPLPAVTPTAAHMVALSDGTVAGTGYALQAAFRGPAGPTGAQGIQGPQGVQGPAGPAGSGTGTSFTPGRSVSLVAGTLEAGGYYNARSFGAIGDGTARALSAMASFRGQTTTGWTLAQWQAVLPHVTALSNQLDWACVQDAARVAKAAGGGVVYAPKGTYLMSDTLTCGARVVLQGDANGASTLFWTADLGAGRAAIKVDNPGEIETFWEVADIRIQGNGSDVAMGVRPYQMHGVELDRVMRVNRCHIKGFFAGVFILNDHNHIADSFITGNYYNCYWGPGSTGYGNHYFYRNDFGGAKFACFAVAATGSIDNLTIQSAHAGFAPYGMYREATADGSAPAKAFVTNSTWTDLSFEACGNGGWYDENAASNFANVVCNNVNIDMNDWNGGAYVLAARPVTAAIRLGQMNNVRVIGTQELIVPSDVFRRVTVGAIVVQQGCNNNDFGGIAGSLQTFTAAKPYLTTGGDPNGNTWRGLGSAGYFSRMVEQSGTTPAGTVLRTKFGLVQALPWSGNNAVAGVTAAPANNGACVPVATEGVVAVRKVAAAIGDGVRVVASLGTAGAAEAQSGTTSAPAIGTTANGAAAGDATVNVALALHTPRYIGTTPSLTYSRATENAAQAQLRGALVAQGLAVDATTA